MQDKTRPSIEQLTGVLGTGRGATRNEVEPLVKTPKKGELGKKQEFGPAAKLRERKNGIEEGQPVHRHYHSRRDAYPSEGQVAMIWVRI